jgi:hypothetical protein
MGAEHAAKTWRATSDRRSVLALAGAYFALTVLRTWVAHLEERGDGLLRNTDPGVMYPIPA